MEIKKWFATEKKEKYLKTKVIFITAVIIIVILLLLRNCSGQLSPKKAEDINALRKRAYNILEITWRHYKNRENFEGDWWSEKFKHPKLIEADGRPNAFMDSIDIDMDGIKDIDWSNPSKPFEVVAVSEAASYAMLRAIWMKDKKTFDLVWNWTKANLQHSEIPFVFYWKDVKHPSNGWKKVDELGIERDHLFAWRWTPTIAPRNDRSKSEDGIIYYRWQQPTVQNNPNEPWRDGWDSATDADEDIALALIFANSLWGSNKNSKVYDYATNARLILKDLWDKETYIKREYRYLAGGPGIKSVEPGYLSPFSYRIFDDFDPERNWMDLVDSTYRVMNQSSVAVLKNWISKDGEVHKQNPNVRQRWPKANLPPDWTMVDKNDNMSDGVEREEPEFGTDAFRSLWRVAVDYAWYQDRRAGEYLKPKAAFGPYEFLEFRLNDKKGDWSKTKNYNEAQRLSSIYWHDGAYALYESNYEPAVKIPNRIENASGYRANCAQYGVYLSYFWGSYLYKPNNKTFEMINKLVYPLLEPEADGFSKRKYIIPKDQLANESVYNISRQYKGKINPNEEIGTPYHLNDGWYSEDSAGGYWTVYDHSEWNSQMDYFSNSWAWLGLAFFAGAVKNFYVHENIEPELRKFEVYLDKNYDFKAKDYVDAERYYLLAQGKDKNPKHRDFFYMRVITTQKDSKPIIIKMVETGKHTGVFKGDGTIGLESSQAERKVAGSVGKYIDFFPVKNPNMKQRYRIGQVLLTTIIEDFEDGGIYDANPMAWWTDSLKPESGKPKFEVGKDSGVFIWKDNVWHIRFLGKSRDVFSGMIITDGLIESSKVVDKKENSKFQQLKKSLNFTFVEGQSSSGIDFTVQGKYIIFDIKMNGYYQSGSFAIGANSDTAFGAPLVLRNEAETGTYKLKINKEKAVNSRYSLQIDKKYIGKLYPYLGGVLFNPDHMDWKKFDEFSFDLYLPKDVGPIRVDIQDANGTVVILNGYNPWSEVKGAGWYRWHSNNPTGVDVNAGLVHPFSIRYRDWWKGWSFDEGRNIEKTKLLDLSKIRNIMFCVHGGVEDSSSLLIDNLTLEKVNYYYGYNPPRSIRKINFFQDSGYKVLLDLEKPLNQEIVYIEVEGKDASPGTYDKFSLKAETTDKFPGCYNIEVEMLETAENSGIYRGYLKIGVQSDPSNRKIGAAQGNKVRIYEAKSKRKGKTIDVGNFKITTVIDEFDDLPAGQKPESWWIDTIDPASGRPIYPAGNKMGYFIWKEENIWKIRWSSDQTVHRFTGEIFTDGIFRINQKLYLNGTDMVELVAPNHIKYDTTQQFAENGIDFKVDGKYVDFTTLVDGKKYPENTWVGPYDWNKAYTIPFRVNNFGKTRSYETIISNKISISKPNSMQVIKTYSNKDYPYIGKWGLSGELSSWQDKDRFSMWIYLRENVGNIRVDLEDVNKQTAILHEYNPWDAKKGPGWYLWTSAQQSGTAIAEGKIDPRPIKDRLYWKTYDTHLEQNIDVTDKFKPNKVLNVELCIGGGEKKNSVVNIDNLYTERINRHIGGSDPLLVKTIKFYNDERFAEQCTKPFDKQVIYVQLNGVDGDRNAQDKIFIDIYTNDKTITNNKITIPLDETNSNTGIYRGKFKISLETNEEKSVIGAVWHSTLTFIPHANQKFKKQHPVGLILLKYIIDDYDDNSIDDKFPVTWWISGETESKKSYVLSPEVYQGKRTMRVQKRYVGDDYPYFGAWGLKSEVEKWSDKEDFFMYMYLVQNPGEIRVDIQDKNGVTAVLNGYNPWDEKRGAGWYLWQASVGKGSDYENGYVDLTQIKHRKIWVGWNQDAQKYIDVTHTLDMEHIQNVQVQIDGEGKDSKDLYIDEVYLSNHNYYLGLSRPKKIDKIQFFYDPSYKSEIPWQGNIIFRDNFVQINGVDSDPKKLDMFYADVKVIDKGKTYGLPVAFWETDVNSGIYQSKFDLMTFKNPDNDLTPTPGNKVVVMYDKIHKSRTITIKSLLTLDFAFLSAYLKAIGSKGMGLGDGFWPWLLLVIIIVLSATLYYIYQKDKKKRKNKNKVRFK